MFIIYRMVSGRWPVTQIKTLLQITRTVLDHKATSSVNKTFAKRLL